MLNQAFDFFKQHNINIHNIIHHSDRGVQYASTRYTDLLRSHGYRISMPKRVIRYITSSLRG
ncbi:hypothetical protein [Porphyromonas sp.]